MVKQQHSLNFFYLYIRKCGNINYHWEADSKMTDKKQMTEEDIKFQFISPAITAKWNRTHIRMEAKITDGRISLKGNYEVRSAAKKADYLLFLDENNPIAIVEAKDNNHTVSYGLQQAMTYAKMMDVPFAYSSNGDAFYEHDFLTGLEKQIALEDFPSPEELKDKLYGGGPSDLRDAFLRANGEALEDFAASMRRSSSATAAESTGFVNAVAIVSIAAAMSRSA